MKRYRDQKDAILRMDIDPAEKRRIIDELDRNINLQLKVMPQLRRLAYDEQRQAG
jgi:heme oxygenase